MTATPILQALAKEFSAETSHVQSVLEMTDAGLGAPFIGRFRRSRTGGLSESIIRRIQGRREELQELDRRRGTILRLLEKEEGIAEAQLDAVRHCMDRFELEDAFVPHRRPEPEVQLAIDRGLDGLADELIAALPPEERPKGKQEKSAEPKQEAAETPESADTSAKETASGGEDVGAPPAEASQESPAGESPAVESDEVPGPESEQAAQPTSVQAPEELAPADAEEAATESDAQAAPTSDVQAAPAEAAPQPSVEEPVQVGASDESASVSTGPKQDLAGIAGLPVKITITPDLARVCPAYVNPDRGVHTETEALAGAVRILSDRLARNARLRGYVRSMFRKRGVLKVRPLVDPAKAGRHKGLLKLSQPLRQIQGHRLIAIRQAQKDRVLGTVVSLAEKDVMPRVRTQLGKHNRIGYRELLDEVARKSLEVRLAPVIEADVRLELKERADHEALRFLSQHLRQILFTPPYGQRPVIGVDVSARGDLTFALIEGSGAVGSFAKIEAGEKEPEALGRELVDIAADSKARLFVLGHGKGARAVISRLRQALTAVGSELAVGITNEAGLSSYANSALARQELPETTVPQRMAVSLGRRLQDPMAEILKVDPRHLGLGPEQGLVSKANLRRVFNETIQSCVAHVGCVLNEVPLSVLQHVPGLDLETAKKLIEHRSASPIRNREQLRSEGLLDEARWTSCIAFLRIPDSTEPLDRTSLHPEQYDQARSLLDSVGGSVEEMLAKPGATRGLKRVDFDIDELTWRDLMRELSFPGRDPRGRLYLPELLDPRTDPIRLTKDRVVTGWVSSVASFGAFVDVGMPSEAMIHISEISNRYVRDARELLSIGQTVRARILESGGPRLTLSLKNVPPTERSGRGRHIGGHKRGGAGRGRQEREDTTPVRAARSRRDGLGGTGGGGGRRQGGRGGPGRGGAGGRGRDGRGRGRDQADERVDLENLNATTKPGYSPFANFFKEREGDTEEA